MKTAFQKAIVAFLIYVFVLIGALVFVVKRWSQMGGLAETMQMVDFTGILLSIFGLSIMILISIGLVFWLAHAWSVEQPALGDRIIRLALVVSILLILVFGGMGGGFIVLRTLWTIGYF